MLRWFLILAGTAMAAAPALANDVLLVGNKAEASVWALSTRTGMRLGEFPTGEGPHEVVVSPDRSLAVVGDYGGEEAGSTLTVIDWPRRGVSRTIDLVAHTRPHGIRFLPDSHRVVVTTEGSQSVLVVDLGTGRIEHEIEVGGLPHMVALSPDGSRAYASLLRDGALAVIDVQAGTLVERVDTGAGAEGLDVTPDGREIWVGNRDEDSISIVDAGTLEVVATLPSAGFPIRVTITPDGGQALVTNARSAELAVFDIARREEVARVQLAEDGAEYAQTMLGQAALPIGAVVHPDGGTAYVAISGGDEVAVIDTSDWSVRERWETGREPDALALIVVDTPW